MRKLPDTSQLFWPREVLLAATVRVCASTTERRRTDPGCVSIISKEEEEKGQDELVRFEVWDLGVAHRQVTSVRLAKAGDLMRQLGLSRWCSRRKLSVWERLQPAFSRHAWYAESGLIARADSFA